MNTLDALMGLNQQGQPQPGGFPIDDPYYELAMQGNDQELMQGFGVEQPDPYSMMGMPPPQGDINAMMTQQMLGGQPPQVGQGEIEALAQALGLGSQNNPLINGNAVDPMYSQNFNIMSFLGGGR